MNLFDASRDSVFRVLHAASRFEVKQRKQQLSTPAHLFVNSLFIVLFIFPFGLSMLLAVVIYIFHVSWLRDSSIVSLLIAYVGVLAHPLISVWIHRKSIRGLLNHPLGILLRNASDTATVDLRYLPKLDRKPLKLLEIVALEVRAEREFFERRISLIAGPIEKVGLGPGLLATFLSLHQMPSNLSNWVLALAYATPALYLLGVMSHFLVMRLDRMSKLLELAIARKRANATPSIHRTLRDKAAQRR